MFKRITRDIPLFFKNPKEYIFSFTYSTRKKVTVYPYDPVVNRFGKSLVAKIEEKYPHMKVNFFGSTSLGIAGQKDIDLIIPCSINRVAQYSRELGRLFGKPGKRRERFSEWSFKKRGCDVQILIIDKNHPLANKLQKTHTALKKSPNYLKEYEAIKLAANGVSEREYARRRLKFFSDKGL